MSLYISYLLYLKFENQDSGSPTNRRKDSSTNISMKFQEVKHMRMKLSFWGALKQYQHDDASERKENRYGFAKKKKNAVKINIENVDDNDRTKENNKKLELEKKYVMLKSEEVTDVKTEIMVSFICISSLHIYGPRSRVFYW